MSDDREYKERKALERAAATDFVHKWLGIPVETRRGAERGMLAIGLESVKVYWMGYISGTYLSRSTGHLLIDANSEVQPDIHLLVRGSIHEGFMMYGWIRHTDVIHHPTMDYGHGPVWSIPAHLLGSPSYLKDLVRWNNEDARKS